MLHFFQRHWAPMVFFLLISSLGLYMQFNLQKWERDQIYLYDVAGYYAYLPSTFIHQDLDDFESMIAYGREQNAFGGVERYQLTCSEVTGRYCNKYPIGVAVMQLPSFWCAHLLAKNSEKYAADGYSIPYQMGTAFSNLLYVIFGLVLLYRLLRDYFSRKVSMITLLILFYGTNLYYYATFDPGMSHTYLFFLYALCLWASHQFHTRPATGYALLIGLSIGLAVICRPTDILLALVPLCWPLPEGSGGRKKWLLSEWKKYLGAIAVFFVPVLLQMCYWQYATGSWVYYSYGSEGFDLSQPAILRGLFSFQKGWFIYTPLAVLGFIGAGYWYFGKGHSLAKQRSYLWGFFLYFGLSVYILFSWYMWYYGGSYGARVFVQSYALMALPVALLVERWTMRKMLRWVKTGIGVLLIGLVALNLFQSYQFHCGVLHWERTSRAYYFSVFLQLKVTEEEKELLKSEAEMERALERRMD